MSREQEIRKIAQSVCGWDCPCCDRADESNCRWIECTIALYNAGYRNADDVRKETAREILKMLHEAGGCHSTDEWGTGYDAAIDFLFAKIQRKYGLATEEVLEE